MPGNFILSRRAYPLTYHNQGLNFPPEDITCSLCVYLDVDVQQTGITWRLTGPQQRSAATLLRAGVESRVGSHSLVPLLQAGRSCFAMCAAKA